MAFNKKKDTLIEPRINNEIKGYSTVRLLYTLNNEKINKVVSLNEARRIANELGQDMIEVNGNITPPIIRLDNYSKYLYELKKKAKQQHRNKQCVKEVQLSTNISEHDLEVKAKKAREFITNGDKVKVVLTMRGRELSRRDISKKSIYVFITLLEDVAVPEHLPKDEGNKCIVILRKK